MVLINKFKLVVNRFFRFFINMKNRKKLKNKDICLISSNCNGCLILHDLGLKYNSPFVNLYIEAKDYIKLLKDFSGYMSLSIKFTDDIESPYPIAMLGDIFLHCVHYKSKEDFLNKWNERKKRMNNSNLYILFTDRDGCTYDILRDFDSLPFKNKIVLTKSVYKDIKSSIHISGFENDESVGNLYEYKGWNGIKYYDDFDYVNWFNQD